jgi:MATE family multidrug resistance protein
MPTAWLLGFHFEYGASGLWWGLTAGLSFAAISLTGRFVVRGRRGFIALGQENGA